MLWECHKQTISHFRFTNGLVLCQFMTPFQSVFLVKTYLLKTILRCYPVTYILKLGCSTYRVFRWNYNINISKRTGWKQLQRTECLTKCQTTAPKAKREDEKDKNGCLMNKLFGTVLCCICTILVPLRPDSWLVFISTIVINEYVTLGQLYQKNKQERKLRCGGAPPSPPSRE